VAAEDRAYAARVIAARTGIPQAEAEQRVNQTLAQAKDAADKARRAAAKFSIWIAISLLAGAFSASLAAAEGENQPLGSITSLLSSIAFPAVSVRLEITRLQEARLSVTVRGSAYRRR